MLKSIYGKKKTIAEHINIKKKILEGGKDIGDNLTLTYYDTIKKLRPYKDNGNKEKWQEVIDKAIEALQKTRDLNIVIWLIEGEVYKNKLEGLKTLVVLQDLLLYHPNCYPLDLEKKKQSINYIQENILSWLVNEELINGYSYKESFNQIESGIIEEKLLQVIHREKKSEIKKYIEQKSKIISEIQKMLWSFNITKESLIYGTCNTLIAFLKKLETMYKKILEEIEKEKTPRSALESQTLNSAEIYQEIEKLIKQGLEQDKRDIVLYLLSKTITLHRKNSKELLKIIKEDSIEKLLND